MRSIRRIIQNRLYMRARHRAVRRVEPVASEGAFRGQYGQDRFVAEELGFPRGGFFVDIGASDGLSFSNSYFFEKALAWEGVAVEPLPDTFATLARERECRLVNACVWTEKGEVEFLALTGYTEMLSGIMQRYDPRHLERIEREQAEHGGERKIIRVPAVTFDELLDRNANKTVDFLSVDTEGSELAILRTIDFARITVRAIAVENNYADSELWAFLVRQGFELRAVLGCDEIYLRRS